MRIPIVAGNWKMNNTIRESVEFVSSIKDNLERVDQIQHVIAPPFVALAPLAALLKTSPIKLAAQNMYFEDNGAYTGEIAPGMLEELVDYVILGHSERRGIFGETDELVNKKVHAALKHNLIPIVCVGENLDQNESGQTDTFVANQVHAALKDVRKEDGACLVIAYEPIWAIGTGKACNPASAQHVIGNVIRQACRDLFGNEIAEQIRIQYGGSVKVENIADFMQQPDIDGALVGGASLKPSWVELSRKAIV
ncbi:MAG: triose-phosphate isomerase [Anaerolineales bacterium]|nr:triose-phosphate isomerase [Anaerolineales bacterium]